jgi:type II secretory ATPase GspE/PulE/Tfp pilus assembly ATPase PilB-like protein
MSAIPPPLPPSEEFTELGQFQIHPRSVRLLRQDYCEENHVVVLGTVAHGAAEPVTVGMLDPARAELVREIARRLGRPVKPVRLNAWEIRRALAVGWGEEEAVQRDGFSLTLEPVRALSFEEDTPVSEMLDQILGRAVALRASDIHVEFYEGDVDVRVRIDGVLHQVATPLSRDNVQAVVARLKVLADLDIAERRRAQDGRIKAVFRERGATRPVDFRLSVVPGPAGEDAVLRILDGSAPLVGMDRLGLPAAVREPFERMIANPEGLLLVTGPTGSGKTTTLYSALLRLQTASKKILTAEDPIEYSFPKINQKQVSTTMSFADYGRAFLRQNPDVILIGEIRDEPTAEIALRAAQTGHLVLSTLHTNDAVRSVARLSTLGVEPHLVAGTLLGALAQRLLRRICAQCKEEAPASPEEAARLGLASGSPFFRGRGCRTCGGTGYAGRVGIFELFALDEELADLIADSAPPHRLRAAARQRGMRSLLDDALDKAREGVTSLAEILRTVPYRLLLAEVDEPRA